jgi:hypothetical protein
MLSNSAAVITSNRILFSFAMGFFPPYFQALLRAYSSFKTISL